MMTIRKNMEFLLRTKGITKQELARRLDVAPSGITQYMDSPNIGLESIRRIARALEVSSADLIASPPLSYRNKPSKELDADEKPVKASFICPCCGHKINLTIDAE